LLSRLPDFSYTSCRIVLRTAVPSICRLPVPTPKRRNLLIAAVLVVHLRSEGNPMQENVELRVSRATSNRCIPSAAYPLLCIRWLAAITGYGAVDPHNPAAVARAMRYSGHGLLECQAEAVTGWLRERGVTPPPLRVPPQRTRSNELERDQPSQHTGDPAAPCLV